jgi:hypothetical protein
MDQREEQLLRGIAAGLDPLIALAALPDEPTNGPPSATLRGWWSLAIAMAVLGLFYVLS